MNRSSGQPASDPGGMRYSSLADIHRTNVARLQLAWTWTNDEPRGTGPDATLLPLGKFETTPLMAGDTLFLNSIGRTDLWGGSMPEILSSIHNKLLTLSDDTLVIAGHGPSTTVGDERRNNPFLR